MSAHDAAGTPAGRVASASESPAGRVASASERIETTLPAGMTEVCPLHRIDRESGVAALVHGQAVAVFRTYDDQVFALSNRDPFGRASVLARGIVGTRRTDAGEVPFVASPLHKHAFDLRTGQCLDDPTVSVPSYDVVVSDGVVLVGDRRRP